MICCAVQVFIHVHVNSALISCNCLAVDNHVHAAINCNSTVICADTIVLADSFAINTIAIFLNCCNVAVNSQFRALFSIQAIGCTICTVSSAFDICIDIQGCAASCYSKGCISVSAGFICRNQQLACGNIAGNIRLAVTVGIDCSLVRLQRQRIFACIYSYTLKGFFEGCYPISRNFCYAKDGIFIAYGNSAVLRKGIFLVTGSNTCVDIFCVSCSKSLKLSCKLGLYRFFRFYIATLTILTIEGNIFSLQCCAACSQAVGNLHITGQVAFAVYIVAVGQLACQCVQYVGNAVLVVHSNAGVIGNQAYCRILFCMLDNGVTCCVVSCCFTIAGMSVVDIGIAAVVINSQVVAVILENVACFGITHAADKLGNMAACKRIYGFTPFFVVPGCTVLQEYIDGTIEGFAAGFVAFILEAVVCYTGPFGIRSC